jgi:hypothetical protein
MSAVTDLWNAIHAIITSGDWITLGILVVVAIALAFFSDGLGSLASSTLGALVVFVLALFARAAITSSGKDIGTLAQADWHSLMLVPLQTVLAYAIIMAVVIAVVSAIKSALGR